MTEYNIIRGEPDNPITTIDADAPIELSEGYVDLRRPRLKDIPVEAILRAQHEWYASPDKGKPRPWGHESLTQWPAKLVLCKMQKLVDQGYLEYGVSLRTAWLTAKGKAYLEGIDNGQ